MAMLNENNIFEKGMLISLNLCSYAGRKKLDQDQLKDLPKEIVRGVHNLFETAFKEKLDAISSHDTETRAELRSIEKSVPFPINGICFIPYEKIEMVIEYLDERKISRQKLVEDVLANYSSAKQTFADKYPEYYAKAQHKYLSKEKLAQKFYFQYQFLKISAPDKNPMISPEQYKREMEKFRQTIQAMKQEVVGIIYQSLSELTNRLKKQSKDGKMNQRTFNNLHKFLEQVDDTYASFVDRKDLQDTLKKVKAEIKGMSADMLRDNDAQRAKFHKAISSLTKEIEALPDVEAKRAIDF